MMGSARVCVESAVSTPCAWPATKLVTCRLTHSYQFAQNCVYNVNYGMIPTLIPCYMTRM